MIISEDRKQFFLGVSDCRKKMSDSMPIIFEAPLYIAKGKSGLR